MKIAILGSERSILGFKALGVQAFSVKTQEDFEKVKNNIEKDNYAVVFVTSKVAERFSKDLQDFYERSLPAVLIVPGSEKESKKGWEQLKRIIEKAAGTSIIEIR